MDKKSTLERRMLAAIMFTDIQGFTQKMNMRESMGFRLLHKHNEIMDAAVRRHKGRVIKTMGDSYMVSFDSAVNAVQCALNAEEQFGRANAAGGLAEPLLVRISIHSGDVVVHGDDVFGDGVNIASHLQEVTPGGSIYVSQEVYAQVRGKISASFRNMGFCRIKGVAEPMEIFQVFPKGQLGRLTPMASSRPITAVITTSGPRRIRRWILAAVGLLAVAAAGVWLFLR